MVQNLGLNYSLSNVCCVIVCVSLLVGVAVATAFCPLETAAVVDPTEWVFGVPPTGIPDNMNCLGM